MQIKTINALEALFQTHHEKTQFHGKLVYWLNNSQPFCSLQRVMDGLSVSQSRPSPQHFIKNSIPSWRDVPNPSRMRRRWLIVTSKTKGPFCLDSPKERCRQSQLDTTKTSSITVREDLLGSSSAFSTD
ncbi:hypothetical protein TNCT_166021 [Trichonephila clavata]|uniref:Uncharacterized protein n=1 Tax=Trichonephila clavata TaxID=2740835 RepID=A0A8X6H816_TRICU|nr:hypothetical protein TNCT_166021 [Trichonephila clavata]